MLWCHTCRLKFQGNFIFWIITVEAGFVSRTGEIGASYDLNYDEIKPIRDEKMMKKAC